MSASKYAKELSGWVDLQVHDRGIHRHQQSALLTYSVSVSEKGKSSRKKKRNQ